MRRKILIVTTVAALAVVAGCLGGGGGNSTPSDGSDGGEELSASEIRNQSLAAMKDVETAKYEMNMNLSTDQATITMDADGVLDIEAKKQRIEMDMTVDSKGRKRSITSTTYIDGNTAYVKAMGSWQTRDISSQNIWQSGGGQIGGSRALLESMSVSKNGTATVGGTEAYVLNLEATDTKQFKQAIAEQMSNQGGSAQAMELLENSEITNFDATLYVPKDTGYVRKMTMNFGFDRDDGQSIDMSMTIRYTDINGDVGITIPADAKESASLRPAA
jgi:outer membrane lipoprotein-sorting protein